MNAKTISPIDMLGRKVNATLMDNGWIIATGKVVAYCDQPQVLIEQEDGSQIWWRADLCDFGEKTDGETQG